MTKWVPSILAAILGLLGAFADPLQHWIAEHPAVTSILAGVATIVATLLKSPISPKEKP